MVQYFMYFKLYHTVLIQSHVYELSLLKVPAAAHEGEGGKPVLQATVQVWGQSAEVWLLFWKRIR
jgi:hypothetical protein